MHAKWHKRNKLDGLSLSNVTLLLRTQMAQIKNLFYTWFVFRPNLDKLIAYHSAYLSCTTSYSKVSLIQIKKKQVPKRKRIVTLRNWYLTLQKSFWDRYGKVSDRLLLNYAFVIKLKLDTYLIFIQNLLHTIFFMLISVWWCIIGNDILQH